MTDLRTGCPDKPVEPPENIDPPDWLDADDVYYQRLKDRRFEDESLRTDR